MDKTKKIWMLLGIIVVIIFLVIVMGSTLWTKSSHKQHTHQDGVEDEMGLDVDSNSDSEDFQSFVEEKTEGTNKNGTNEITVSDSEGNNEMNSEDFQSFVEEPAEDENKNGTDEDVVPDSEEPEDTPLQVEEPKDEGYGPLL